MANPMYGQNKADSRVGQVTNKAIAVNLGTLGDNVVLTATDMITAGAIYCDPAAARNATTPTAALLIAGMETYTGGSANVGDSFEFSLINAGSNGDDETITVVAGTGVTIIGFTDVENNSTTHDAFSGGSGLFRVQMTGAATCDVIRLA
tara:strand:- start:462 stop:908 length:447 start_codon:yes stop_codon:yes gene_type:complete